MRVVRLALLLGLLAKAGGCAVVAIGGAGAAATATAIDSRTTGAQVEDQTIEVKAYNALNADAELKEQAHLNVTSYNTVVLLTGETPTPALRRRAVALVQGIDKVTHIYDEITIAAPSSLAARSADAYLTAKVKTRMFADTELSGLKIKVVSEAGVVYLMGLVSRAEADRATDIARRTGGAQKVVRLFQHPD